MPAATDVVAASEEVGAQSRGNREVGRQADGDVNTSP